MDWQQPAALTVVATTAVLFVASWLFPRRARWARSTHCGCPAARTPTGCTGPSGTIVVRSRRGDARQTIIHRL